MVVPQLNKVIGLHLFLGHVFEIQTETYTICFVVSINVSSKKLTFPLLCKKTRMHDNTLSVGWRSEDPD